MILSPAQEGYVNAYVEEIIQNLPPRAMQELLSGYEDDLDRLLLEMKNQVCMVTHMDRTLDIEKLEYLSSMERSMDQSLRKLSYNYFKTTMLPGFRQGWRNLEWGNIFQLYPYSSVLASRGSGKCFSPGTEVLMFDGSCKRVEDIEVGDEVMGRDFLPRKVTELHHGVDTMYRVTQDGGMTYTVNKGHLIYCALLGTTFRSVPVESVGILKHMEYDVYGVRVEEDKIFPMFQSIKVTEVGQGEYYGFVCNGDHLFLLKDGTIVHNSFEGCFAFTLWRLYSYDRPSTFLRESVDNANRKETCIITNNETLGKKHIAKMVEEITHNDLLTEKLNPTNKASLAATSITTETGSILHLRSKDSMIRGLHVGAVVCDDLPDESSLYSQEQREKMREVFYGSITPIVEPYGYLLVMGTPYSPADIYGNLKEDKRFKVFEYPAVFPNGQLLAPDRLTFKRLTEERESLGTIVFNREYLVVPIADTATIFPYEYLKRSIMGMEHISFANDIESFPIKLTRVVTGCDFALSGNIGADYSVYTVWGVDSAGLIYLVAMLRMQGASHDLQVNKILEFNARYKPNKIICEANGFQRILAGMAKERGLVNIEEFVTTEGNKKDLRTGLPSLSALFESARLRVPYGNEETRKLVDIMFGEFNSIAFNPKKGTLESASGHDDICMSSFMAIQELREHRSVAMLDYID